MLYVGKGVLTAVKRNWSEAACFSLAVVVVVTVAMVALIVAVLVVYFSERLKLNLI